jgi:DNA-binding NtrC family response regulator
VTAAVVQQDKATLLFVDDEQRVLNSMRAMFRRDYVVLLADSGEAALNLIDTNAVDVIVSDQRMPSMTGVDVLREVKRRAPRAMRILLTGYADLKAVEASINEGEVFRYLTKPCATEVLRDAVALAVEAAGKPAPAHAAAHAHAHEHEHVHARPVAPPAPTSPAAPAEHRNTVRPVVVPASLPPAALALREDRVELLLLTKDADMTVQLGRALNGSRTWHKASSLEAAVSLLESRPIGVLLTDSAVDERAIRGLTSELKRHVPQLVTIVASDRSDAQSLIELINYGQIFRFLLKPFHSGQCRLWVDSAVKKHLELVAHPETASRHRVVEEHAPPSSVIQTLLSRMRQIRHRFVHFEQAS